MDFEPFPLGFPFINEQGGHENFNETVEIALSIWEHIACNVSFDDYQDFCRLIHNEFISSKPAYLDVDDYHVEDVLYDLSLFAGAAAAIDHPSSRKLRENLHIYSKHLKEDSFKASFELTHLACDKYLTHRSLGLPVCSPTAGDAYLVTCMGIDTFKQRDKSFLEHPKEWLVAFDDLNQYFEKSHDQRFLDERNWSCSIKGWDKYLVNSNKYPPITIQPSYEKLRLLACLQTSIRAQLLGLYEVGMAEFVIRTRRLSEDDWRLLESKEDVRFLAENMGFMYKNQILFANWFLELSSSFLPISRKLSETKKGNVRFLLKEMNKCCPVLAALLSIIETGKTRISLDQICSEGLLQDDREVVTRCLKDAVDRNEGRSFKPESPDVYNLALSFVLNIADKDIINSVIDTYKLRDEQDYLYKLSGDLSNDRQFYKKIKSKSLLRTAAMDELNL